MAVSAAVAAMVVSSAFASEDADKTEHNFRSSPTLIGFDVGGGEILPPDPAPSDAPPTIHTEEELAQLNGGRWVAPVMYGGLGYVWYAEIYAHACIRNATHPPKALHFLR